MKEKWSFFKPPDRQTLSIKKRMVIDKSKKYEFKVGAFTEQDEDKYDNQKCVVSRSNKVLYIGKSMSQIHSYFLKE